MYCAVRCEVAGALTGCLTKYKPNGSYVILEKIKEEIEKRKRYNELLHSLMKRAKVVCITEIKFHISCL